MDFYEINFNKKNRRPITETTYQIDAAEWNALGKKVRDIHDMITDGIDFISSLSVIHEGGQALNICDERGNIVVRFSGGQVRTKMFDSRSFSNSSVPDDMSIKGTSIIIKGADFSNICIEDTPLPTPENNNFSYSFPFSLGDISV